MELAYLEVVLIFFGMSTPCYAVMTCLLFIFTLCNCLESGLYTLSFLPPHTLTHSLFLLRTYLEDELEKARTKKVLRQVSITWGCPNGNDSQNIYAYLQVLGNYMYTCTCNYFGIN